MPTVLIADDNAVSLQFLAEAVRACGYSVHTAGDGAQALRLASAQRFDVLLLDLSMPELGGEDVVRCLRIDGSTASRDAVFIATSADLAPARHAALHASGFADAIAKPIAVDTLWRVLQRHLPAASLRKDGEIDDPRTAVATNHGVPMHPHLPLLDDAAAMSASGDAGVMSALRGLFAQELKALPDELQQMKENCDVAALRDRLHRLRASCGFCGAPALDAATMALRQQLDGDGMPPPHALASLLDIAARTRDLLPHDDA